jgi:hypothetical protein
MRGDRWAHSRLPGVRYRGLLVLVLWQTVPLGTYTDEAGRTRVGFGFGAAQFEAVSFDCEGRPTSIDRGRHRAGGVSVETIFGAEWRVSASAGFVDDSHAPLPYDPPAAFTGAVMVTRERENYAVGAGVARLPHRIDPRWGDDPYHDARAALLPALHVRVGSSRVHFRGDMLEPAPALGTLGEVRTGIGFGPGMLRRGVSGFGGVALCHVCLNSATGSSNASAFMELGLPVSRSVDVDVGALFGPGRAQPNLGLTVGGRVYTGAPARPAQSLPAAGF